MSESTFTISFKFNDKDRHENVFNLFNNIAANPEKSDKRLKLKIDEAKQYFISEASKLIGSDLKDNVINLINNKEFYPESLTKNTKGFTVLYMIGSSTAGFGGWPGYKHLLAMEELFTLLGVDKLNFPLLKEAKSMGSMLEVFDDVYDEKPKDSNENKKTPSPTTVNETIHLTLSDENETKIELALIPGNLSDYLTLAFDDGQKMEFNIGMITGAMFQEKIVSYKGFNISFKTKFYLESKKTTSRYSGHIGVFHVNDTHVLDIEF